VQEVKEALKNIFMGIALGIVMAGFVLSIIEGRLLLASRENYGLISFYIFVLITTLSIFVYLFKDGINNTTLAIGILSAIGFVISEILISLDLVLAFSF
jgi:hypothetical protein